ncbi:MFS transporter [Paraburkholderia acidisoli]|uniref:MFS transporter n=1 Tax=Paraburkholderia acidisoli TaxID=2571748 RepID=A0A7Z2GNU9_9BURK|nr:MFS transporter [Paraburkholderia acidisoli]QGZ65236.1 MFS transporter [Paraburkholderia acidisoli]
MADHTATLSAASRASAKSVQEYIDECPVWPDGTRLLSTPMTAMQWRIWSLAAAGKFFEGFVVFMTGVALPLISREFGIGAAQNGLVSAASLIGILVGALGLGGMSDYFGRKRMFIIEMVLFCCFLVLLTVCGNYTSLVVSLFGLGVALGCDYPTAHMIISESIPSASRGKLVLAAFGFQALGALGGTGIGYLVLSFMPTLEAWRWMYATAIVPAVIVTVGRFFITESPSWLYVRGKVDMAQEATRRLLHRKPAYPADISLQHAAEEAEKHGGLQQYLQLFSLKNLRATIFSSAPWFLQDLGTYGIGIFTPTILAVALGSKPDHVRSVSDLIMNDILAAKGAALTTSLLIVGILFAVMLADRFGRVKLQVVGFVGCAVGLFIAALSGNFDGSTKTMLIFAGFMLFNFMTNVGPNAQTYLLAGEVFPTAIRGAGAGFAAAVGKIGAILTAFLFPILLVSIGTSTLLYCLVVTSLLGAVVTWLFRIETTGVRLDEIGK